MIRPKTQLPVAHHDPVVPEFSYEFPLTEAQREIWVSASIDEQANKAFNLSTHLKIDGPLNTRALKRAAEILVARHAALRCRFSTDGGSFRVDESAPLNWLEQTLDLPAAVGTEQPLAQAIDALTGAPFSLAETSQIRFGLFHASPGAASLVIVVHHIVCDGWSLRILLDELSTAYAALLEGNEPALASPDSYSQFALRNAILDASGEKQFALDYWVEHLGGLDEPARLPPGKSRPPIRTYSADSLFRWFDDKLSADLIQLARSHNVSLFTVLLTLYTAWISRLAGDEDVVVGVPVAGQPFFDMPELVGHCANMLPYRCGLDFSMTFGESLAYVQNIVTSGYENQAVTFGEVLKLLKIRRDASLVPLVPVTLNLVTASSGIGFAGCQVERVPVAKKLATFELTVDVYRDGDRLQLEAIFNSDLFATEQMERWLGGLETLAQAAVSSPEVPLAQLPMVSASLFASGEVVLSAPRPDFDLHTPVTTLIDRITRVQPSKTAIVSAAGSLSYAEVLALSQSVASYLKSRGARPGGFVGVSLGRDEILPVLLLGIMRTGAAYLPIDPVFPPDRRAYMLSDSGASLLLASSDYDGAVPEGCELIAFDTEREAMLSTDIAAAADLAEESSRAYVIYTSGSTGNPKGVEVSHHNLTNFLLAMQTEPGLTEHDKLLAITSISFDISLLELFLPLITGATLYVADSSESTNGDTLAALVSAQKITVMQGTPSSWRLLLASGWEGGRALKALCGGEPLPAEIVPQLLDRGCELWNMYGPTETTVWSSLSRIDDDQRQISIGTAVANNTIHILDASLGHCLPGVSGEICIGGDGVTPGYLGRSELTAERFVNVDMPCGPSERLYRTGDLGMLGIDGKLYHQGRMDFQLKVRGYRMEAGEIETCLTGLPGIEQAVVGAWPDQNGEQMLVGFLRGAGAMMRPSNSELRSSLASTLPAYMIPQRFEWRDEFPLTPNGKIDRKKLQPSTDGKLTPSSVAGTPLSKTEASIADIWQRLIGGERPGRDDTFFEVGGHSLLAVRAINEINALFSVKLPVHMIALEELGEIADHVEKHGGSKCRKKPSAGNRLRRLFRWVS